MRFLAILAAALFALPMPVPAQDVTPAGLWEAPDGRSRYEVTFCGENNRFLCGEVAWIHPRSLEDNNRHLVGEEVFQNMPPSGRYRWTGPVHFQGYNANGTVQLVSTDELRVGACMFIVVCRSTVLTRVAEGG